MRRFLLASLIAGGIGSADAAQVYQTVSVTGELVMLGDLVSDAGTSAHVAVFRAPDLGKSGVISADRVVEAAARYGVEAAPDGFASVTVRRESRLVEAREIELLVRGALERRGLLTGDATAKVHVAGLAAPVHLPVHAGPPEITAFDYAENTGDFLAHIAIASRDSGAILLDTKVRGSITRFQDIAVLTRRLDRYEVIGPDDVMLKRVEMDRGATPAPDLSAIVGMSVKRPMRPGAAITGRDLTAPIVIRRNETVTMTVRTGRLMLSARGRALADGAAGDIIKVINMASRRTVEGRVTPAGTIEIEPRPSTLAVADLSTE